MRAKNRGLDAPWDDVNSGEASAPSAPQPAALRCGTPASASTAGHAPSDRCFEAIHPHTVSRALAAARSALPRHLSTMFVAHQPWAASSTQPGRACRGHSIVIASTVEKRSAVRPT